MALGTITVSRNTVWGDRQVRQGTVQCSSGANYTTGGEPITAAMLGLNEVEVLRVNLPPAGTRLVAWDHVNKKLKVFTALSAEAASNSDQSAIVCTFEAIGY